MFVLFPAATLLAALFADERKTNTMLYGESPWPTFGPQQESSRQATLEITIQRLIPVVNGLYEAGNLDEAEPLDAVLYELMEEYEALRTEMEEGGEVEEVPEGTGFGVPNKWYEPSLEESLCRRWANFHQEGYWPMSDDPAEEAAHQALSYQACFHEQGLEVMPQEAAQEAEKAFRRREALKTRYRQKTG